MNTENKRPARRRSTLRVRLTGKNTDELITRTREYIDDAVSKDLQEKTTNKYSVLTSRAKDKNLQVLPFRKIKKGLSTVTVTSWLRSYETSLYRRTLEMIILTCLSKDPAHTLGKRKSMFSPRACRSQDP